MLGALIALNRWPETQDSDDRMGQWDVDRVLKAFESTASADFKSHAVQCRFRGSMSLEAYNNWVVSKSCFWAELQADTCVVLQKSGGTRSESEKQDATYPRVSGGVGLRDKARRANKRDVLDNIVQGVASRVMIGAYYGNCEPFCVLVAMGRLIVCCAGEETSLVISDKRKLAEQMTFIAVVAAQRILNSASKDEGKCKACHAIVVLVVVVDTCCTE